MAFPQISSIHTDIWVTFWNTTWKAYIESLSGGGTGSWPYQFTGNGRIIETDAGDGAAQLTGSPSLAVVLPEGAHYVLAGVLVTLEEDTVIPGISANFEGWIVPVRTWNEVSEDYDWTVDEYETRPALGSGVAAKIITGASSVTDIDASEAESDVILAIPLLLQRLNGGGGGEEGATYWNLLARSAIDPMTIAQYIAAQIEEALGGNGTNLLPSEVRDEVMVNTLHSLALHQNYHNDAFENVPPHHAIVVSPGRGTGDWEYSDLTDEELTTMPVNPETHTFGEVA